MVAYSAQPFPICCSDFLYGVAISCMLSKFPVSCRNFLYGVAVSCTVSKFPVCCRDFHYGEPALVIPILLFLLMYVCNYSMHVGLEFSAKRCGQTPRWAELDKLLGWALAAGTIGPSCVYVDYVGKRANDSCCRFFRSFFWGIYNTHKKNSNSSRSFCS